MTCDLDKLSIIVTQPCALNRPLIKRAMRQFICNKFMSQSILY